MFGTANRLKGFAWELTGLHFDFCLPTIAVSASIYFKEKRETESSL